MADPRSAQRTLVKSPPELWAEVSDGEALARHLEPFGEIRITRLEPETTVAWEGDRARGTVELEAAGWGTRVTLTAVAAQAGDAAPTTEIDAIVPPADVEARADAEDTTRRGWLSRLFGRRTARAPAPAQPLPEPEPGPRPAAASRPEPVPAPVLAAVAGPTPGLSGADAEGILSSVLDDLGAAHHRPFSR